MALRFEKAFGVDMEILMRMQNSYDIAETRSREKQIRVRLLSPPSRSLRRKEISAKSRACRNARPGSC